MCMCVPYVGEKCPSGYTQTSKQIKKQKRITLKENTQNVPFHSQDQATVAARSQRSRSIFVLPQPFAYFEV